MTRSKDTLRSLALHDEQTVHRMVAAGFDPASHPHLSPRTYAFVRLSALVSIDAPVVAYQALVELAYASGVAVDELVDVLRAIAPIVGGARLVAAASALGQAVGHDIEAALEAYDEPLPPQRSQQDRDAGSSSSLQSRSSADRPRGAATT